MGENMVWCQCGRTNLVVYLLVILFGISSWVDINGLWVELPILVQQLPESWDLPSYMSVIIQVANIAPLTYTLVSTRWPHRLLEVPVSYAIISLGAVSCLLLSFLWSRTSELAGRPHSTALFGLQFCLALVDCTSSVAFLPFMSRFQPKYMTAYFLGEGFSGLIPSLLALGQGAGNMKCVSSLDLDHSPVALNHTHNLTRESVMKTFQPVAYINHSNSSHNVSEAENAHARVILFPVYEAPRFSVRVFFLLLMVLLILSLFSFTLLNFWSYCQQAKTTIISQKKRNNNSQFTSNLAKSKYPTVVSDECQTNFFNHIDRTKAVENGNYEHFKRVGKGCSECNDILNSEVLIPGIKAKNVDVSQNTTDFKTGTRGMSRGKYALFLLLTALLNAISNGLLPSIQSYSCLPYGIKAYHLSVSLANIANPAACLVSFLLPMKSSRNTVWAAALGVLLSGYIMWTACASPHPPLVSHTAGPILLILCWVLATFVMTYTKVAMATRFREEGRRALLWVGASTQAGSLLGAVISFMVVSVYGLLQTGNPCV